MKLHLIYFSPGGTTKRCVYNVAEGLNITIASNLNMTKYEVRRERYSFGKNDLVIIGFPTATKLFGIPREILNLLEGNNTPFVGVVTCGNSYYGKGLIVLKKEMEKRGFVMVAGGAFVGQYSFDKSIGTNRPDNKDKLEQVAFGKEIYKKVVIQGDMSFRSKLKIDWPNENAFSTFKCAVISVAPIIGLKLSKSMNHFKVSNRCIKCKKCLNNCPTKAIDLNDKITFDTAKCIGCQGCVNICPVLAIEQVNPIINKLNKNVKKYQSGRKELDMFF